MANHPSALKRARQNRVRRMRNMAYKTRVKTAIKKVRSAVDRNAAEEARESLIKAVSIIQKTASKGVIHKKNASRKISRLTRRVNQMASS
ncbi:MAG: 30S ribosomal protein S20 [Deltaproteobacteria bacterium]|nr:30S ribosomal protein S20 [Deltaproteobacteria bacterium]MBW2016936.1 30S ribosomal protein S20 [Deltaproteobacteria bacterium]MBW2127941.1 30S ribosomal protein S20 [Deltaproteobacteria bacterium]MBW2303205.1 30S ribosomal protein S20 [Deltaproteobacteria bacterium]